MLRVLAGVDRHDEQSLVAVKVDWVQEFYLEHVGSSEEE